MRIDTNKVKLKENLIQNEKKKKERKKESICFIAQFSYFKNY